MSMDKPPFCTQQYCSDAQQCVDAERCIGQGPFKDYPARIEHPDGKTSPPIKESLLMEQLLKTASDGRPNTESKLAGRHLAPQDAVGGKPSQGALLGDAVPSLDLSELRVSIDKACETIDYLREVNKLLERRLRAIITADTRYQSAQIALRADGRFANMQEAEVASEKMRAAIEDARKALS